MMDSRHAQTHSNRSSSPASPTFVSPRKNRSDSLSSPLSPDIQPTSPRTPGSSNHTESNNTYTPGKGANRQPLIRDYGYLEDHRSQHNQTSSTQSPSSYDHDHTLYTSYDQDRYDNDLLTPNCTSGPGIDMRPTSVAKPGPVGQYSSSGVGLPFTPTLGAGPSTFTSASVPGEAGPTFSPGKSFHIHPMNPPQRIAPLTASAGPASKHDAYVAKLLGSGVAELTGGVSESNVDPGLARTGSGIRGGPSRLGTERTPLIRSSSAPGVNRSQPTTSLPGGTASGITSRLGSPLVNLAGGIGSYNGASSGGVRLDSVGNTVGDGRPGELLQSAMDDGKPIFQIFDAELDEPAENLATMLKGHLEEVLRVQEEVGRMHLSLEGLCGSVCRVPGLEKMLSVLEEKEGEGETVADEGERDEYDKGGKNEIKVDQSEKKADSEDHDDNKKSEAGRQGQLSENGAGMGSSGNLEVSMLEKRERGVEEIMNRLSTLSATLRFYHDMGTPVLSFPTKQRNTSSSFTSQMTSPTTPSTAPALNARPTSSSNSTQ